MIKSKRGIMKYLRKHGKDLTVQNYDLSSQEFYRFKMWSIKYKDYIVRDEYAFRIRRGNARYPAIEGRVLIKIMDIHKIGAQVTRKDLLEYAK